VRMRAALPFLLAAVLGIATAARAACGSCDGNRRDLIPPRSADRLKSALSDVEQAVDNGDCDGAARAVARARGRLVLLPRAVDDRLVARLRQGIDNLANVAARECEEKVTETTTEETTETTTPETTPEETATTETSTTPTTPTDTTTTPTTPTTDTGATTPPETTPPTAPPGDTTDGTGNP
jgi:hypothetical protein